MKNSIYIKIGLIIILLLIIIFIFLTGSDTIKLKSDRIKAKNIVSSLSLREKIGQMIMPAAREWSDNPDDINSYCDMTVLEDEVADAITKYNLCGICLYSQNCKSTEQLVQLTSDLQNAALKSSSKIPLLISVDQEGGYITRLSNGTSMIGNMALAATGNSHNAKIEAEIISAELKAVGINVNFAPDSDVNDNPENPVIGIRSFSDNPDIVTEYAATYIDGLHENNVISCLKHFPGHGNTSTDSHTGLPKVDKSLAELKENELKPFINLTDKTDMIMTAHIQYPQIESETYISISSNEAINLPATMSKTIINDILRDKMNFDGVVVTDALEMAAISENFLLTDVISASINAGVDLFLIPYDLNNSEKIKLLDKLISDIEEMVLNGKIEESKIDDSVIRIITLKQKRCIMDIKYQDNISIKQLSNKALSVVGSKAHHDTEWNLAIKAITLYQDINGTYSNGIEKNENVLYLCPTSSQKLSLDFALQKLSEENFNTDDIIFNKVCYENLNFQTIQKLITESNRIILVTKSNSLSSLNTNNSSAVFCNSVIEEAKKQGKEIDLISSMLPYDAAYYKKADIILLAYNPSGIYELPQLYDGHLKCYGVNLSAAIATLITGCTLTGHCPVMIYS